MYKIYFDKLKGINNEPSRVLHIDLLCNSGYSWCRYISEISDIYIFLDAVNANQIGNALLSKPTHIVLGGGYWGKNTQDECVEKIKKYIEKNPNTIIFGYWGDGILNSISNIDTSILDVVFCAFGEAVDKFKELGVEAVFYPHPVDCNLFNKYDINEKYDWCFVGTNYGAKRNIYIEELKKVFPKYIIKGLGFEGDSYSSYEETSIIFSQSKIIININDDEYCSLSKYFSDRLIMGMMCGKLVLTNNQNNLDSVFKIGTDLDTYKDLNELIEKMKYYLNVDYRRKEIGDKAILSTSDYSMRKMFPKFFETALRLKEKKLKK